MALVTLSGFPCSGKSTRAKQLQTFLEERQPLPVILVDEDTINVSRSAYDAASTEKPARAALFSAVTRNVAPGRIVICDAMNYIKGFRYQLYCAAREARCRTCTIQIATPADQCKEWNSARSENAYTPETLDNLISRYEEPSPFVRWDSPLIVIPWSDIDLPADAVMDALTKSELRPPNQATNSAATGTTDYLQLLESTAGSLISALLVAQAAVPGGGSTSFAVDLATATVRVSMNLPARTMTMPQLQRMRRQFVTLQKKASGAELSAPTIAELFARYVEDNLQ